MKRPIKAAIYGDSGAGKTTMLGTLENPFIAATDENTLALELTGKHYILVTEWSDFAQIREQLAESIRNGTCPYTAACIDTITNTEVLVAKGLLRKSFIPLSAWSDQVIPNWRDEMLQWCDFANPKKYEHPIDVVFTARVSYQMPEGSAQRFGSIDAPGKALSREVYAWMDEVFHIEEETGIGADNNPFSRHIVHTRRHENFLCKDGSRSLDAVEEPDFVTIKKKIDEKLASVRESREREEQRALESGH